MSSRSTSASTPAGSSCVSTSSPPSETARNQSRGPGLARARRGPPPFPMLGAQHRDARARRSRPAIRPPAPRLRPLAAPRRRALRLVRAPMKLVPILSIEPASGGLRYRLDVPEGDLGEPLQEEFQHPIDDGTIQALQHGADALLRSGESPTFTREAEARGAV